MADRTALVVSAHSADFVWRAGGAIALHAEQRPRGHRGLPVLRRARRICEAVAAARHDARAREERAPQGSRERGACARRCRHPVLGSRRLSDLAAGRSIVPAGRSLPGNPSVFRADAFEGGSLQPRPPGGQRVHPARAYRRAGAWSQARAKRFWARRRSCCSSRISRSSAAGCRMCSSTSRRSGQKKRAAIECMAGQEHLWEYYTRVAEQRGVQAARNSDKKITYGEAYEAVFPHVVESLVPTEGRA